MYAAIDLGTNSIRILLAQVKEGQLKPIWTDLQTTRLGEGMHRQPLLTPEAIERTLAGIKTWAIGLEKYSLQGLAVVATSAVRQAANGGELVQKIREEVGWEVKVISGPEEARLSYEGAAAGVPEAVNPLVVDVGGGSTELVLATKGGELTAVSVPIGAVRLSGEGWTREGIAGALESVLPLFQVHRPRQMVAVGGTATSLAAMEQKMSSYDPQRIHGYSLSKAQVQAWLDRLGELDLEQRRALPGLQAQRADIIDAGVAILAVVMEKLALERMTVSEWDLLHGLVLEMDRNREAK